MGNQKKGPSKFANAKAKKVEDEPLSEHDEIDKCKYI